MSIHYSKQHRVLQAQFGTEKMADRIEQLASHVEFNDDSKGFIEHSEMFFLTTIDDKGRPTVSYKGGNIGFVKVIDANTLIFPSYDGNGMFLSMGNIVGSPGRAITPGDPALPWSRSRKGFAESWTFARRSRPPRHQ